jgi:hypothetical protein
MDLTLTMTPAMTEAQERAQVLLGKLSKMEPLSPLVDDPHGCRGSGLAVGVRIRMLRFSPCSGCRTWRRSRVVVPWTR